MRQEGDDVPRSPLAKPEDPEPHQPLPALRPISGQDVSARRQGGLPPSGPQAKRTQPSHSSPAQQEDHQGLSLSGETRDPRPETLDPRP